MKKLILRLATAYSSHMGTIYSCNFRVSINHFIRVGISQKQNQLQNAYRIYRSFLICEINLDEIWILLFLAKIFKDIETSILQQKYFVEKLELRLIKVVQNQIYLNYNYQMINLNYLDAIRTASIFQKLSRTRKYYKQIFSKNQNIKRRLYHTCKYGANNILLFLEIMVE
ncbi:hypothetical protein pb186bvf_007995 [Paramecium bursaria]